MLVVDSRLRGHDGGLGVSVQSQNFRSAVSAGNRIARVIFCLYEGQLIALHAFIKKTQKTPKDALELATKRMKELV